MTPSRTPVVLVTGANKGIGFEVARDREGGLRGHPRFRALLAKYGGTG